MQRKQIIAINYRGGETFFDPYGEDVLVPQSYAPIPTYPSTRIHSIETDNVDDMTSFVISHWKSGMLVVGTDCITTYSGIRAVKKYYPDNKIGLIVADQHMDIYSPAYSGSMLNKANVIRRLLEDHLIAYAVFVGTRPSEEAIYQDPEIHIDPDDAEYAGRLRNTGVFAGLEGLFSIIPVYRCRSFSHGVNKASDILNEKGITNCALMIDIDVFNSTRIKGVTYNTDYAKRISVFMDQRKKEKNIAPDPDKVTEIMDYVRFMEHEIKQEGLSPDGIAKEIRNITQYIRTKCRNLLYVGITEYQPGFKDENTDKLVRNIIRSL